LLGLVGSVCTCWFYMFILRSRLILVLRNSSVNDLIFRRWHCILLLLLLFSSSSSSSSFFFIIIVLGISICRVLTLIFLWQNMFLANIVLQQFWCNYSWLEYRYFLRWLHCIIIIIITGTLRNSFYHQFCLQRRVVFKWWIRRIIPPASIQWNVLCRSQNVCLKHQYSKNGCSTFLIHWQSKVELQNTILNVTHFLIVSSYWKYINKLLDSPLNNEGKVELRNSPYNCSIYKVVSIIQGKCQHW